jgi:hypothetical protein
VRIERILRTKIEAAGLVESSFPSLSGWIDDALTDTADPQLTEESREILQNWLSGGRSHNRVASIVSGSIDGFLAAVIDGSLTRIIVKIGDRIGESPQVVRECLSHCAGTEREPDLHFVAETAAVANSWLLADHAMSAAQVPSRSRCRIRAAVGRRLQRAVRRAPVHGRAIIAAKSEKALEILQRHMGVYDEMEISRLFATIPDDAALVDQILRMARGTDTRPTSSPQVVAMIVLTRR